MWSVECPDLDAGETFATCISRVRNPQMRRRLRSIRLDIEAAADDYIERAESGELHKINQVPVIGGVPGTELVKTYDSRMAKGGQPGRPIYDQIKLLPENDRCPFCGHRNVSTLDHFLPKQLYPIFAVTPVNLVASCSDCNKAKLEDVPASAEGTLIHPYFDDVEDEQWLFASVARSTPAALTFYVQEVAEWDDILNARVAHQFAALGLARLYSTQAGTEITNIRHNLRLYYDDGGIEAVRNELQRQWASRQANNINSWQTACYEALSQSDWFCDGGFAEI